MTCFGCILFSLVFLKWQLGLKSKVIEGSNSQPVVLLERSLLLLLLRRSPTTPCTLSVMDHLHLHFENEKGLKSSSFNLPFTSSHSHPRRRSSSSSAILLILVSIPFFYFYFVSPFSHLSILDQVIPHPPSSTPDPFNWTRCSVQPNQTSNPGSSFKCSQFKVPLDYSDPLDQRTISLALTLFQSGREKSNHTIILNPGGPGGSGTDYAYRKAEEIDLLLGGGIDVLGFDPRGELNLNLNLQKVCLSIYSH